MKKEKEEEDFWVCDGAGGAIPRKNEEGMRKNEKKTKKTE